MKKGITGDRIIQIILLILITAGIGSIVFLNTGSSGSKESAGRPQNASQVRPDSDRSAGAPGKPQGGRPGTGEERTNAVAVEARLVQRGDVNQYIKVNGDVSVETQVEIYSDTNGKLVNRQIELGDRVSQGQMIASVDPSLPGQNYSVSSVKSTISGTVISLPLQVGDKVTTSSPIATIGNLKDLVIRTYIPEKFIASLKEGLKAEVYFDAFPSEKFTAEITEINPVMDVVTRTLEVKLELDRIDRRIRPGMFATMKLVTKESLNTLSVPSSAVLSYYGDPSVYIINDKKQAERRIVETGLVSDELIEITAGLNEGDMVIIQGQSKLTDNTAVRTVSLERS